MPPESSCGQARNTRSGSRMRTAASMPSACWRAAAPSLMSRAASSNCSPIVITGLSEYFGSCITIAMRLPRIEHVAQAVPDQVEAEADDEDGDARIGADPPPLQDLIAPFGPHGAPFRLRRRDAEAEEAEAGGDQDHARHVERDPHDQRWHAHRHDVADKDAHTRCAAEARGRDIVGAADSQRLR